MFHDGRMRRERERYWKEPVGERGMEWCVQILRFFHSGSLSASSSSDDSSANSGSGCVLRKEVRERGEGEGEKERDEGKKQRDKRRNGEKMKREMD